MKIEALSPEQIEHAKALETNEERLAYLKECGVELDEEVLSHVAGGINGGEINCKAPNNPFGRHRWAATGKRKKGWLIFDSKEYVCRYCKATCWM